MGKERYLSNFMNSARELLPEREYTGSEMPKPQRPVQIVEPYTLPYQSSLLRNRLTITDPHDLAFFGIPLAGYDLVVSEPKVRHPVNIDKDMCTITIALVSSTGLQTSQNIFQWICTHIVYDKKRREEIEHQQSRHYRDAMKTFHERRGVCGEMANLNVAMARIAGLTANYVHVEMLEDGTKAIHACAGIVLDGKLVLSDPAYRKFDVHHHKYELVDDINLESKMRQWNYDSRFG